MNRIDISQLRYGDLVEIKLVGMIEAAALTPDDKICIIVNADGVIIPVSPGNILRKIEVKSETD